MPDHIPSGSDLAFCFPVKSHENSLLNLKLSVTFTKKPNLIKALFAAKTKGVIIRPTLAWGPERLIDIEPNNAPKTSHSMALYQAH